jgi:hypothetical protein
VSGTSGQQSDSGQLSPFAQLLSTLQQLQQSNPTEYKQVTQQIATNLQNAAQTATSDGNTSAANQLTQLATDFTTASQSGQLPNISDLAQAIGGGGHHHHHGHHASSRFQHRLEFQQHLEQFYQREHFDFVHQSAPTVAGGLRVQRYPERVAESDVDYYKHAGQRGNYADE